LLQDRVMAVSRTACAAVLLVVLLAGGAAARKHPQHDDDSRGGKHNDYYGPRARGYAVQGESQYNDNRPKDPTPLNPTGRGTYAIAHRGSSGELPEHTLEDYDQAIRLGADFFECDTVLTKDGVLVCRHEPNLSNTTNADSVFPDRIKTYTIDFVNSTGVHAIDLTVAEVKQLKARQRVFFRDQSYNDMFSIPTFQEYIDLALNAKRVVGIYPETKHPVWHDSFKLPALQGRSMTQELLRVLKKNGYGGKIDSKQWLRQPVFIQSFETKNLQQIRPLTNLPLVQLLSGVNSFIPDQGTGEVGANGTAGTARGARRYGELVIDSGLKEVAAYADGIGPDKGIIAPAPGGIIRFTTDFVKRAHNVGLQVHPYTFRNEPVFIASNLANIMSEYELYFQELDIDGAFADYVESEKFYFRARRQNAVFPRRQVFPQVSTATNASATL
jgi:glycerophosphoryl diester phosphodiesterase